MNARSAIDHGQVLSFLKALFEWDVHAKRVLSMANATLGVIRAASLSIHAIGHALAQARGLADKHAIKQVDRLLSNPGFEVPKLQADWVRYQVGERTEMVVAMDWTEFDKDDQSTIALSVVTSHGRTTPLLWKTVKKSGLKDHRNEFEDEMLLRLRSQVPPEVTVTILADRGFGDQKLFALLERLGFHYIIRFRGSIHVTDEKGETRTAAEWVPEGSSRRIRNARVTQDKTLVAAVVLTRQKRMKEAWCLATSYSEGTATDIIKLYGRRFSIEEDFRDIKDLRFGMGLSATRISSPERRDRLLLISAMAIALLTLLGAAGESLGMDRLLKANTVKRRTHSLFTQGCYYYAAIPMMKPERLEPLIKKFADLVQAQPVFRNAFGLI